MHVCRMTDKTKKLIPSQHLEESKVAGHTLTCSRDGLFISQIFIKWLLLYASICSGWS